ncbi:ATP-binding protein [Streptomyces sp. NPDC006326]|uniref:ATP-binding protein n=1 Tax=Streptomyces sp. NPDC006326 TaxID=3156752 RepID=UPI0033BBF32B
MGKTTYVEGGVMLGVRHRGAIALSCEEARDITRGVLGAHGVVDRLLDDVLTVVTELVSNARRHAGGVVGFGVRCTRDAVVVEVADGSRNRPVAPGTPVDLPGGFGWLLVNRLAQRTEVRLRGDGKTITALLPRPHVLSP